MTIIYVESNTTGFGHSLLVASSKYDEVFFLTHNPDRYHFLKKSPYLNVILCDTGSLDELTSVVQRIRNVQYVASTSDACIDIVARLSERLNTIGNSSTAVSRCRDKLQLQETLWAHRVAYPRTISIRGRDQLPELEFPVVLKPRGNPPIFRAC